LSLAALSILLVVALAPGSEPASAGQPSTPMSHLGDTTQHDEVDPLAASLSSFAGWGCHGPAALGMVTGALVGGLAVGVAGAWGTYVVNAGVPEEQRTTLVAMSFLLSATLGVLVGGALGAAIGLVVEAIVPDEPVRRVIRVADRERAEPSNGVGQAAIVF
jgi:MFS family permease